MTIGIGGIPVKASREQLYRERIAATLHTEYVSADGYFVQAASSARPGCFTVFS
jgi:hypothetical protein